ncbi:MAG: PAS domain S-box protein, partial [Planctomycetia bacterium]|nr:PAS domain S-box protein [Planctomycetia bacterium]
MFLLYFNWILTICVLVFCYFCFVKPRRDRLDFHVLKSEYRESFFHLITENISISFFCKEVENDFRYINCNKLCKECLGRELISFTDFDILPRDLAEKTRACDESLLDKPLGTVAFFEEKYIDHSGGEKYVKTYKQIVRTSTGSRVLLGIGIDITEEVLLRKKYEEGKILFQTIMDNIPVGIVLRDVDDQKRFLLWNKEN